MERLKEFIRDIYGFDSLSCMLLFLSVLLNIIGLVLDIKEIAYPEVPMQIVAYVLLLICIFRVLSLEKEKREVEDEIFHGLVGPIFDHMIEHNVHKQEEKEQNKIFKIFKCPSCRQKIRVPRNKGKIEITCPECSEKFIRKT